MTLHPAIIFTLYKLSQFEKFIRYQLLHTVNPCIVLFFAGAGMYVLAFVSILINLRDNSLFGLVLFSTLGLAFWYTCIVQFCFYGILHHVIPISVQLIYRWRSEYQQIAYAGKIKREEIES